MSEQIAKMYCVMSKVTKGKSLHTSCYRLSLGVFGNVLFYMMRFSTYGILVSAMFEDRKLPKKYDMTYPPAIAELKASRGDRLVNLST
jgi:hypothetical protein